MGSGMRFVHAYSCYSGSMLLCSLLHPKLEGFLDYFKVAIAIIFRTLITAVQFASSSSERRRTVEIFLLYSILFILYELQLGFLVSKKKIFF
jgi:hypothetical protein